MIAQAAATTVLLGAAAEVARAWRASVRRRRDAESLKRRARRAFRSRVEGTREASLLPVAPSVGWKGTRKFVVSDRVEEARDVCSFRLVPQDGRPVPEFQPGQFLTLQLRPIEAEPPIVRCYSLSAPPSGDGYRITVKRLRGHAGGRDGRGSTYLHEQIGKGAVLDVKAPAGDFAWPIDEAIPDPAPAVMIAGGIGITPLYCMAATHLARGSTRPITLYYGVRNSDEAPLLEPLRVLSARHANFALHVFQSRPRGELSEGDRRGRVTVDVIEKATTSEAPTFYACGPPAMMRDVVSGLGDRGVPPHRVLYEAFGPASVRRSEHVSNPPGPDLMIAFSGRAERAVWDGSHANLLELAEAAGVPVESGCRVGNCGTCVARLRRGRVRYDPEPALAPRPGTCLLCVARPESDLLIET